MHGIVPSFIPLTERTSVQATRLTLICHARTVAQKLARFPTNEPVEMDWQSAKGSRSRQFKRAPRLLCGPELRTRQTAELFGDNVEIVTALGDCDFGRWQGTSIDDLQTSEPETLQTWLSDPTSAPHGGESVAQLGERVAAWLKTLEATPEHVVAITHPFVIRAALMQVLQGAAFNQIDVEPLSAIELRFNGRWRFRLTGMDPEGAL
ncbi:broad specificity phosphatase PhoE [Pseudomonas sp. KD5]|jgi:broad specificity phosphatase PhoE|nr:broad specificity phosphatase PhoE [Pseudomonas sp. KD5]